MKTIGCFLILFVSIHSIARADSKLVVENIEADKVTQMTTQLPSLERYTRKNAEQKLAQFTQIGRSGAERIVGNFEIHKFYIQDRLPVWAKLQNQFPEALFVRDGRLNFSQLAQQNPQNIIQVEANTYLLIKPLVIAHGATLVIDKNVELRLSEEKGTFIINSGNFFVFDSRIIGWREAKNGPSLYQGDPTIFRPFFTSMGGSETYFVDAYFASLGYEDSKSYGISFVTYSQAALDEAPKKLHKDIKRKPYGWLVNTVFEEMYFGFYSYEAEDVAIVGNEYKDNIIYGIDPHDRSRRLIIARNTVYGAKKRHGIIASREVTDSYIFENVSFSNNRSGIMLDRSAENNVIINNTVYDNGGDGITIYESSDSLIADNKVYKNKEHGIRVRNSLNATLKDNILVNNGGAGVYFHIRDLADHTHRDFELDPYVSRVSGSVEGGLVANNQAGGLVSNDTEELRIGKIQIGENGNKVSNNSFLGDLGFVQSKIIEKIWADQTGVKITNTLLTHSETIEGGEK